MRPLFGESRVAPVPAATCCRPASTQHNTPALPIEFGFQLACLSTNSPPRDGAGLFRRGRREFCGRKGGSCLVRHMVTVRNTHTPHRKCCNPLVPMDDTQRPVKLKLERLKDEIAEVTNEIENLGSTEERYASACAWLLFP
ncbi:hypothetical protein JZ751_007482 [Albula glossodonta]|uniref:Uncharacterized protein n=1 Tax=Albula glossodonta TaxID=121402 RepID=A0A8T2N3Q1_9TELE|nr:hypothetical protein JZ751_007482 [Albula glossodonta]